MRDLKRARQASLLALLQRHEGRIVDRATIERSIEGYEGSDEAVRKMLQRDLADLAETCDLEVEYVSGGQRPGYRVRRRPLKLELEPQDLAMLAFVASSLGPEDRAALQLEALGASPSHTLGVTAPIEADPELPSLIQAIEERREVRFKYRKPGDAKAQNRRVLPWALVHRGGWYLIGHCLTRKAERRFKLARMESAPALGDVVGHSIPQAIAGICEPWATGEETALLSVDPSQARMISRRLGGTLVDADNEDAPLLEVSYGDEEAFAGFLVGFGDALVVVEPDSLKRAVISRLDRMIAASGGGP